MEMSNWLSAKLAISCFEPLAMKKPGAEFTPNASLTPAALIPRPSGQFSMLIMGPRPVPPATKTSGRLGSRRKNRPNGAGDQHRRPALGGRICSQVLMAPSRSSRIRNVARLLPGWFTNE